MIAPLTACYFQATFQEGEHETTHCNVGIHRSGIRCHRCGMHNRENGQPQTTKPLNLLSTWSVSGRKRLAPIVWSCKIFSPMIFKVHLPMESVTQRRKLSRKRKLQRLRHGTAT